MVKNVFDNFLVKFRVSSNLRAGFLPPNIVESEFPFRIYNGAYLEAKQEIIDEKKYIEEHLKIIDEAFEAFMNNIKESKNYNIAEKAMIEYVNNKLNIES